MKYIVFILSAIAIIWGSGCTSSHKKLGYETEESSSEYESTVYEENCKKDCELDEYTDPYATTHPYPPEAECDPLETDPYATDNPYPPAAECDPLETDPYATDDPYTEKERSPLET